MPTENSIRRFRRFRPAVTLFHSEWLVGGTSVSFSCISLISRAFALDRIFARHNFAAATLAECTYISFAEYLMNADYSGQLARAKQIASALGPEPFGVGLQKWITDSPGFNTDKINIPVLFEENDPVALVYSWDLYAAMRLQNKPVELLYIRNGEHVLRKPLERLASQEMNVDWYDFWLNDHEDPDPAKAEQYARWRELRNLQEQNAVKPMAQASN